MTILSQGKYRILLIPTLIIVLFALFAYFSDSVLGQVSPDAIAIRVIPNPNHYSARRWYLEKKFTGSPQSLLVDGYEAVRDGRSVYVDAANIVGSGNGQLYTNIYIISYNQEAEKSTIDIFGQILEHWSFNVNVTTVGQCDVTLSRSCLKDSECPLAEHCLSPKARIIRDTRRLADLAEIKIGLEKYKTVHGSYVTLLAGSYLPQTSISVWPSWQKVLSVELGLGSSLPIDPINKLGACPGDYNPVTCWDEKTKRFADRNPGNNVLDLPAGSQAYIYISTVDGASFTICAVMESGLVSGTGSGSCSSTGNVNVSQTEPRTPHLLLSSI